METLGQRLRLVRQSLSQQEVAKKLGIPQQTWSNYESGRNNPDVLLLDKIGTMFGVKADWLLYGRGPVYDEAKVHLVHATTGWPNPLRTGAPKSTIENRPEYQEWLDRYTALEARVAELEKELAEARAAEKKAMSEALKAKDKTIEVQEKALGATQPDPVEVVWSFIESKRYLSSPELFEQLDLKRIKKLLTEEGRDTPELDRLLAQKKQRRRGDVSLRPAPPPPPEQPQTKE